MPDIPARPPAQWSEAELEAQRAALRRGLWRASLASVVVLAVVVALAVGVAWKAEQFQTEAERARRATARAESELWNAKLNEARARRVAGGPGARVESAAVVRELVKTPTLDEARILALRQEAIAQLALVDIESTTNWVKVPQERELTWNTALTQYAYARPDGRIEVRTFPEEALLQTFQAPGTNAEVRKAVFSPAGDLLATRFRDGAVRVWRVIDGELVLSTRGTSDLRFEHYPFFSPDGRSLGVLAPQADRLGGEGIRIYDLNSARLRTQLDAPATCAKFSPDGQHLALVVKGRVQIMNATNGGPIEASLDTDFDVERIAWHPSGQRLALSSGGTGRLIIWDVWSGSKTRTLEGHPSMITSLAFSPDGSILLSYGWDTMSNFWEPISGRRLLAENRVGIYGFNNAADKVIAWVERGRRETVQPLLARTGFRTVASTGNPAQATHGVWFHPGGRLIASAYPKSFGPKGVCIWKFPEGELVAQLPGEWAQFTADGKEIITFSEREAVRRFEIPAGLPDSGAAKDWKEQVIFRPGQDSTVIRGTLAADRRTLVLGENKHVALFDLTGKRDLVRYKAAAQNASLSPDGKWIVTEKHQDYGYLLNASTGEAIRRLPARIITQFSPEGRYLMILNENVLSLYTVGDWKLWRQIPLEVGAGTAPAFTFSPDGQMFALAYNRQDVRLFESSSGRELATLSPPNPVPLAGLAGLAFSSDTRWLLAARHDGDIVAWELPVVRAELAKLGLDWGQPSPATLAEQTPTSQADRRAGFTSVSAPMAALLAALLAIGAGSFIFIVQRRMIAGYGRIEAMAVEQREKLETAQEELLHSQKMRALGTLSAGIAHDFNNLLSVIRLSNQLAAEETKASGTARENMDAVESAVTQGETIVQSMLGYSRAAAELEDEYSVAAALSETVAMLGKKFLSGIILKLEVAPDLPMVHGARGRLEQMLLNLVVNASEAMHGQGTLKLSARAVASGENCVLKPAAAANYIEVSVSDSGPGIPEDILPRIFEPFFTTKNAGATPGTGLGLSTVYMMAEQDGFGVGVDTEAGRGTTFRIVVPAKASNFGF